MEICEKLQVYSYSMHEQNKPNKEIPLSAWKRGSIEFGVPQIKILISSPIFSSENNTD